MRRILQLMPAALLLLGLLPAAARADGPTAPAGFRIEATIAAIHHPTRLAFGPDGRLYITQQTGEIMAITLTEGKETARQQVATAKLNVLGLAFRGDDLYLSDPGVISRYKRQADGTYTGRQELVTGLPTGRHQNDGLAFGSDGRLYFGQGSTSDLGPEKDERAGSVMRVNADGSGLERYARGLRNPYGITFTPDGELWVTDNGNDDPPTQDELNHIRPGADYGWPQVVNMPPAGSKTVAPVLLLGDHNSTNGLTFYTGKAFPAKYQGGFFLAEWGSSFDDNVGRAVGFVRVRKDGSRETGEHEVFARGFNRPLDVLMGPQGDLWVADFFGNSVYRIWYTGEGTGGGAAPSSGQPAAPAAPPSPNDPQRQDQAARPALGRWDIVGLALPVAAGAGLLVALVLRKRRR